MANPGRPAVRPRHLSPEQRQRAKEQTAAWRDLTSLNQQQMAREVGYGYSTYRAWESGNDGSGGPSREQAKALNNVLCRLLGTRYTDGAALEVWGWPTDRDLDYARVASLLRAAGFIVPDLPSANPPQLVFWVHRLRPPNLVHGVFALAAAAASRAGMAVYLLLDDIGVRVRHGLRDEFPARIRSWFEFAGGRAAQLSVSTYSAILTSEVLAQRGWPAAETYLNEANVLEFLRAGKVISPIDYSVNAEESVLKLVRQSEPNKAAQLLTPLRNWLVFDEEIVRLSASSGFAASPPSIVTLGGEDERIMWDLWHRGCEDQISDRVQHIYLRPMPMPSYRAPWLEDALLATTSRTSLADFLRTRTQTDGNTDLLEWLVAAGIRLPAALDPAYSAMVAPVLTDVEGLFRGPAAQLSSAASAIAAAVMGWLST